MKRTEIEGNFTTVNQDELKDVLDYYEAKFNEIRDLLDDITFENLTESISDALDIADKASDDLY